MSKNLGVFIIIALFIISVISLKILLGTMGLLFTKFGIALIICLALYFWISNKIDNKSEKE